MTGAELVKARKEAGIKPAAIARAMGVSKQRIRNLENSINVPDEAVARYMAALTVLSTTPELVEAELVHQEMKA